MIDLRKSAELNGMEPIELYVYFKKYPKSGKRVVAYCENCGKKRNIIKQQYHDLCRRCAIINNYDGTGLNEKLSIIQTELRRNNPDLGKNTSELMLDLWSNKEFAQSQSIAIKNTRSTLVSRNKTRVIMVNLWADPEMRESFLSSHRSEKAIENKRNAQLKYHDDNPQASILMSKLKKEYYRDNPEVAEKASEVGLQYYKDHPEAAIKISCDQRGIDIDDFDDFLYNTDDGARNLPEVKEWTRDILERDNYICQICYQRGGDLNVHHIRKWCEYPELRLDINNGITLCVDCHLETYSKEDEYIEFLGKRLNQKVYIG